jgi:hypothetical protein
MFCRLPFVGQLSVSCNSHGRLQGGWLDNRTLPERRSLSAPMGSFFVDRQSDGVRRRIDIDPTTSRNLSMKRQAGRQASRRQPAPPPRPRAACGSPHWQGFLSGFCNAGANVGGRKKRVLQDLAPKRLKTLGHAPKLPKGRLHDLRSTAALSASPRNECRSTSSGERAKAHTSNSGWR